MKRSLIYCAIGSLRTHDRLYSQQEQILFTAVISSVRWDCSRFYKYHNMCL